jgi:hypothetical protein
MSLELAHLVLERCPLRGQLFRALLILALDADDDDLVITSHLRLARWGRFTVARAQEMLERLRAEGWIAMPRRGRRRLNRRRLLQCAVLPGKPPQKPAGVRRTALELRVQHRARQMAEDLRQIHFPAK